MSIDVCGVHVFTFVIFSPSNQCLSQCVKAHIYCPQTKFGARQHSYTCVSFCSGGRGGFPACDTGHMTRRVCIQGGLHPGGSSRSACRGSASRGLGRPPGYYRIQSASRQYVSYWNAFLCRSNFAVRIV